MRKFEKINYEQFLNDLGDKCCYLEYKLPMRATKFSAAYDFYSLYDFVIHPGDVIKVPTGVKAMMNSDEVLMLYVRSSMGFKYNVRLSNQVGVIDCDYYNNVNNDGHIWCCLQNHGCSDFVVKKGDAFLQGMFIKYLITDDDSVTAERTSGIGSTSEER